MQWFTLLETNDDPITACRLMNIFRRKGLKIVNLSVAAQDQGFSWMAVLDVPEADRQHLFNYLRRTEGVEQVTWRPHAPASEAALESQEIRVPAVVQPEAQRPAQLHLPDYPGVESDASFPADFAGLQPEAAF
jgi:hypothetical protein